MLNPNHFLIKEGSSFEPQVWKSRIHTPAIFLRKNLPDFTVWFLYRKRLSHSLKRVRIMILPKMAELFGFPC